MVRQSLQKAYEVRTKRMHIEAAVLANGLERRYYCKTLFWQVIVYTR